jgi:hypothetical protein|tara:strand:+ start:132 stop:425 length:294 start_codon:yes stop_codon:yes gene_type:complete
MINIMTAIQSLRPNAELVIRDGEIEWHDTIQTQPTDAEISVEVTRLQGVYDGQSYARLRKAKYDLLNQFELMTDDASNGTTTHAEAIAAIKAAHPKP